MNTADSIHIEPYTKGPTKISTVYPVVFIALILLGIAGLITGLASDPQRAWQAYLVNFLLFLGIGAGGALFAPVIHMASGRWGRNVKRVSEGLGLFLPLCFFLFLLMIPGLKYVLPWVEHPYGPHNWLRLDFMILRNLAALAILSALSLVMLYRSLRYDIGSANETGGAFNGPIHGFLTRNWQGAELEKQKSKKTLALLAPIYAILFAVLLSFVAMDLIMSLKANWYSTLIGGYYFAGSFYIALAALMLGTIWTRYRFGLHDKIGSKHLHDIAKLLMAFGVVTGDFFYCQVMLIWYGNLPLENSFLIDRMASTTPWRFVGLAVLVFCFALPLVAMLNRSLKEKALPMLVFATVVLCAMWMERFFLVAPSISGTETIRFGITEISITLGFLGILGLIFTAFMHRVPAITVKDPILGDAEDTH